MRLALVVVLALVSISCRRAPRGLPVYSAQVTLWDGPNACQQAGSAYGPHYGGQTCSVPNEKVTDIGAARIDFNFGGLVQVLTGQTYIHGYSLPTPLSATNRYVAVNDPNGVHWIWDRAQEVLTRIPGGSNTPIWDSEQEDTFYYPEGSLWKRYTVSTGQSSLVADMSVDTPNLKNGGSTHISSDNWTAFWSEQTYKVCALELRTGKSYCAAYNSPEATSRVGWDFIDYSLMTDIDRGTNQRYVVLMGGPALGVWAVDTNAGNLKFYARSGENPRDQGFNQPGSANDDGHCDKGENCINAPHADATSINGIQYIITNVEMGNDPCERDLAALPIARGERMTAERTTIFPLAYCSSPYDWPDIHVGCTNKTGACVISTETPNPAPYGNQILYMPDLKRVYKMAFHLSRPMGSDTYWCQSRAAISWDGRYIVYDSNSGQPDEGNGFAHEQMFMIPVGRRMDTMTTAR